MHVLKEKDVPTSDRSLNKLNRLRFDMFTLCKIFNKIVVRFALHIFL